MFSQTLIRAIDAGAITAVRFDTDDFDASTMESQAPHFSGRQALELEVQVDRNTTVNATLNLTPPQADELLALIGTWVIEQAGKKEERHEPEKPGE